MREEKCNTMRERKGTPDIVLCSGVAWCPEFYKARQLWSPRVGGKHHITCVSHSHTLSHIKLEQK